MKIPLPPIRSEEQKHQPHGPYGDEAAVCPCLKVVPGRPSSRRGTSSSREVMSRTTKPKPNIACSEGAGIAIVGGVTVSIVGRHPSTGQLGVATASFCLAAGGLVPHLRRGVGAAAVQAGSPVGWGEKVLDLLGSGMSAAEVCNLLGSTPEGEGAQVAIVDQHGNVAALSGGALEREAGDARGLGVCVAANLMEQRGVPAAAVDAYFTSAATTLSGRLLDALIAADGMGGDVRGRQSAALGVVSGAGDKAAPGEELDLRVDDSRRPVSELGRLHRLWEAQELLRASRGPDGLYRDVQLAQAALAIAPEDHTCLGGLGLALLRDDASPKR